MKEILNESEYESRALLPFVTYTDQATHAPVFSEKAANFMLQYKELRMRYACALKEVRTKFEVLSTEFGIRYDRNPIAGISTRLKSSSGIAEKMKKRGVEFTLESMEKNIFDIAGVRVICSYTDDIYMLADALKSQEDITLIAEKDYIKSPKPNGYRSLHLIVSVPVFFADRKKDINVEVQIRTIAMDFWASLEHEIKYKKAISDSEDISARLKACADSISQIEEEMQNIRKQLEENARPLSDSELLIKKLQSLDTPLVH